MKKRLCLSVFLLSSLTTLFAEEASVEKKTVKESFFYGDLGVGPLPLLIPSFGAGYRLQRNHLGFDVALDASTSYYLTAVKITPSFFYYFSPNLLSQFYAGIGLDMGGLFKGHHFHDLSKSAGFVSPALTFGKQYQNEVGKTRFLQACISFPTIASNKFKHISHDDVLYYPVVYVKYGVKF